MLYTIAKRFDRDRLRQNVAYLILVIDKRLLIVLIVLNGS